jgi:hypothetical protein
MQENPVGRPDWIYPAQAFRLPFANTILRVCLDILDTHDSDIVMDFP